MMSAQETIVQAEENRSKHAEAAAGKEGKSGERWPQIELHRVKSHPDSPAQQVHMQVAISEAYACV
jgi:hypothetical protein